MVYSKVTCGVLGSLAVLTASALLAVLFSKRKRGEDIDRKQRADKPLMEQDAREATIGLRTMGQTMRAKLDHALKPSHLLIEDESHFHRGHAGVRGSTTQETHFSVFCVAEKFVGMPRVQRQREVNTLLREEFHQGLHALSLSLHTPSELLAKAGSLLKEVDKAVNQAAAASRM